MAFNEIELFRIESALAEFVEKRRPPVELREKIDLGFRIERQSVVIFHTRPFWRDPTKVMEEPVAKATFVRDSHRWKIYWQRA